MTFKTRFYDRAYRADSHGRYRVLETQQGSDAGGIEERHVGEVNIDRLLVDGCQFRRYLENDRSSEH